MCVGPAEVLIDLEGVDGSESLAFDRRLEQPDRCPPVGAFAGERRQRHAAAKCGVTVVGVECFGDKGVELLLDLARPAEAHGELEVGEAKLAVVVRIELGPCLQVVRGHAEIGGESPQSLHRRLSRASFDARDIGVGDTRGS
jgi:hypothetical protein